MFDIATGSRQLDGNDQQIPLPPASTLSHSRLDTEFLPPELGFDLWRQALAQRFTPMQMRTGWPDDFRGLIEARDLGGVTIACVSSTECTGARTAKMIRQTDPELLQIAFSMSSQTSVRQDGRKAVAGPSDFVLYSASRPYVMRCLADPSVVCGIKVLLPQTLLPLPARKIEKLTPAVIPGRSGIGGLLSNYLTGLVNHAGEYRPPDAVRLGAVLVDLVGALLANRVEETRSLPPETHHRMLLPQIHTFIEQHLDDPQLTTATVATAHHISLRVLHRLFQDQELGIAALIRHRRLERCRRELTDPALRDRSVQAIAARYGFVSPSHFSRLFRTTYGITPQEYRGLAAALPDDPHGVHGRGTRRPRWVRPVRFVEHPHPGSPAVDVGAGGRDHDRPSDQPQEPRVPGQSVDGINSRTTETSTSPD